MFGTIERSAAGGGGVRIGGRGRGRGRRGGWGYEVCLLVFWMLDERFDKRWRGGGVEVSEWMSLRRGLEGSRGGDSMGGSGSRANR